MYNVTQPGDTSIPSDEEEEADVEASLKRELDAMKATGKEAKLAGRIFTPVKMNVACLLFVRTRAPVEPVEFVKRICQDARSGEQRTRSRYVNRLVPMSYVGRATEEGLVELVRRVLGAVFDLSGKKEECGGDERAEKMEVRNIGEGDGAARSFSVRDIRRVKIEIGADIADSSVTVVRHSAEHTQQQDAQAGRHH